MRGKGHIRQIPCSVGSWSGWCPVYLVSFCRFFLYQICCDILSETDSVMLMVFDCGANAGVPYCPSCALLFDNAFPPIFCYRTLPPLRSCHRSWWRWIRMMVAAPIAAAARCLDWPCWQYRCFMVLLPPSDCTVRLQQPDISSCWWLSRHREPCCKGTFPWSCDVPPPPRNPTSAVGRRQHWL